jgi:hypothetical protein
LLARPEATRVDHLSGASLKGRLSAVPTSIRLGWKGLTEKNIQAYKSYLKVTKKKDFKSWPRCECHHAQLGVKVFANFLIPCDYV